MNLARASAPAVLFVTLLPVPAAAIAPASTASPVPASGPVSGTNSAAPPPLLRGLLIAGGDDSVVVIVVAVITGAIPAAGLATDAVPWTRLSVATRGDAGWCGYCRVQVS